MLYKNEYGSEVVAVGQMDNHKIEVMRVEIGDTDVFEWRALKDEKEVYFPHNLYDTVLQAFYAARVHLYPDTDEVEFKEPEAADFEALSALMYVGGLQEDITSMDMAVGMFTAFSVALQSIALVKDKAQRDVEQIEDILASAHHGSTEAIENLNYIHGIFQSQCDVLATITQRNMQTLHTFIEHFLKQ